MRIVQLQTYGPDIELYFLGFGLLFAVRRLALSRVFLSEAGDLSYDWRILCADIYAA